MTDAQRWRNRAATRSLILLGLLLLSADPAGAALWYENYESAGEAMQAGNWAEAVTLLEAALAQRGESGARVRTLSVTFIEYFPYLKLGIARYNLQEYDAALLAFEAEERLGAIQNSATELAELQRYRQLALDAKTSAEAGQRRQAVTQIISEAAALEGQGDLEGAFTKLSRADAMDPGNAAVEEDLARLRNRIAQLQDQQDLQRRVNDLVAQGKAHVQEGNLGEAAAVFARANSLQSSDEIRKLLDDTQAELAAVLREQQDAEQRTATIAAGLGQARELEQSGDFVRALDALQTVLALDPNNVEAGRLQQRLLGAQAEAESTASVQDRVRTMLQQAAAELQAGELNQSLLTVNRVLALDLNNADAIRHIASIYRELSRQLVSPEERAKIPPIVRLSDFRDREVEDGRMAERVRSPEFRFGGDVLALSAGELRVYDRNEELIHEVSWAEPQTGNADTEGSFSRTEFGVRATLSAGLSVFRIEAANQGGKPVSVEYAALYDRPLIRSPWLYGALIALVAAGTGTLYGRRRRKRRQLLKRRFNPYIAGAPVRKDDLFYGREQLLSRVLQTVHNNSILLHGERRIGKTSFQHHLRRRLTQLQDPDYKFYPVFTDLQGTPEEKFFSTLGEDVFEQLGPELDGLEPHPSLHDGSGYEYKQFVRDIRNVLKKLNSKNEKKIKVALLIDEVDELNDYDPRVNQRLRALFMRSFAEDLVAVVSGVGIKKQWESEGSPWYNFFEEIRVEPFARKDAEELIQGPIRGIFKLDPGAVDRIITLADCKPYLIQKLCVSLVNRMHDEKRRQITVADVDAVSQSKEA